MDSEAFRLIAFCDSGLLVGLVQTLLLRGWTEQGCGWYVTGCIECRYPSHLQLKGRVYLSLQSSYELAG